MTSTLTRVWDRLVRSLHGALVLAVCTGWITGFWVHGRVADQVHEAAGYTVLGIVIVRLLWGRWGRAYARFSQFVRGPSVVWSYARSVRGGHERRYLGHNPLGGWMVVLLLALAGSLSVTGVLYTTDWFWGYGWLADLHSVLAWSLLVAVGLHLAGVLFTGWRHRENLPRAMVTGLKRVDGDEADAR